MSTMPSKTIKITINTGAYQIGPVSPDTKVILEAGYLFSKEGRAPIDEAFKVEDTDGRNRAALSRIAQHVIVSWSVGETDRAAIEQFLLALYDEDPLTASQIIERLADRKRFGRPSLVDAEALGEG